MKMNIVFRTEEVTDYFLITPPIRRMKMNSISVAHTGMPYNSLEILKINYEPHAGDVWWDTTEKLRIFT